MPLEHHGLLESKQYLEFFSVAASEKFTIIHDETLQKRSLYITRMFQLCALNARKQRIVPNARSFLLINFRREIILKVKP